MEGKPLVILEKNGRFVSLVLVNAKAFGKSLENGELWIPDSGTGKVLPAEPRIALSAAEDRGSYYLAFTESGEPSLPGMTVPIESGSDEGKAGDASGVASFAGELAKLEATIAERRRSLPEGSYTSYLFKEGPVKIRKKTGEEAVEVILARDKTELIRETADLIYHLLVLLREEGIELDSIASELATRAR
jgi:phosphoribosyl-AMP cyclohydrolase / phosphoribosyl-ATP pyrophosphohydrolase